MEEAKVVVEVIDDLIEMAIRASLGAIVEDLRTAKCRAIGEISKDMADSDQTTERPGGLKLVSNHRQPASTRTH